MIYSWGITCAVRLLAAADVGVSKAEATGVRR